MSKITRERAAKIAAGGGYNFDEVEELARIALHRSKRRSQGEIPCWPMQTVTAIWLSRVLNLFLYGA